MRRYQRYAGGLRVVGHDNAPYVYLPRAGGSQRDGHSRLTRVCTWGREEPRRLAANQSPAERTPRDLGKKRHTVGSSPPTEPEAIAALREQYARMMPPTRRLGLLVKRLADVLGATVALLLFGPLILLLGWMQGSVNLVGLPGAKETASIISC